MSKIANLGAGILGGFIAGRQAKDRKTRETKQDALYEKILGEMVGATEAEKKSTTAPTVVNPLVPTNATPVTATSNDVPMKKAPEPAIVGEPIPNSDVRVNDLLPQAMRYGGMVMPNSDRMMWQRQSFKK